jgi:hypothetical protein
MVSLLGCAYRSALRGVNQVVGRERMAEKGVVQFMGGGEVVSVGPVALETRPGVAFHLDPTAWVCLWLGRHLRIHDSEGLVRCRHDTRRRGHRKGYWREFF